MKVYFSCKSCKLTNEPVDVRERREGEDIKYWIDRVVGREVQHRHFVVSGGQCEATKYDLCLPVPKDVKFIGEHDKGIKPPSDDIWDQKQS